MTLAQIIYRCIPLATLERVVVDQGVLDEDMRAMLFKSPGVSPREIADKTVAAYGDQTGLLAYGLYDQVARIDFECGQALAEHFDAQPGLSFRNHQASFVARFPTIPMDDLDEFLSSVKRQVCLIVSRAGKTASTIRGTGFLVAPSYVLTCRHVLPWPLPPQPLPPGASVELYFDFFQGEPVERLGPTLPKARKVSLAEQWRVASSEAVDPDGLEGALSAEQVEKFKKSLDFVLLRLAEPVGRQPVMRGGGRRRGWIELPTDDIPRGLQPDDWIIIPQHPSGLPLRIDFGRFLENDHTETRIRYAVNTAKGTSGAPCFNQAFKLVGVHNAYVGPEDHPRANQAIRLDHIAATLRNDPEIVQPDRTRVARWSVSRDGEPPNVIIGRGRLLDWLDASTDLRSAKLADRVYAAIADNPKSGCTFSVDVLLAATRESKSPRVVYGRGQRGQILPATAEDFLRSLLREVGITDASVMDSIPARPQPATRAGKALAIVGEVDKLDRWLANELPAWLGRVLNAHVERKVDARDAARLAVEVYRQQKLDPPPELIAQAKAPEPIIVRPNAWDVAYIVVDDLRGQGYPADGLRTEITAEVGSLIAALVKGRPEDPDDGLRRLRWMFLGFLPDFVPAGNSERDGAITELLAPNALDSDAVLQMFHRISEACFPMGNPVGLPLLAELIVELTDRTPSDKEPRLATLQRNVNERTARLLREVGT